MLSQVEKKIEYQFMSEILGNKAFLTFNPLWILYTYRIYIYSTKVFKHANYLAINVHRKLTSPEIHNK